MTVEEVQAVADRVIDTDAMIYVVVGDAATQEERLVALGYGRPVRMNDRLASEAR